MNPILNLTGKFEMPDPIPQYSAGSSRRKGLGLLLPAGFQAEFVCIFVAGKIGYYMSWRY